MVGLVVGLGGLLVVFGNGGFMVVLFIVGRGGSSCLFVCLRAVGLFFLWFNHTHILCNPHASNQTRLSFKPHVISP